MKSYKLLSIITGLFVAAIITSNILDVKIFHIINFKFMTLDFFNMPAVVIIFPLELFLEICLRRFMDI